MKSVASRRAYRARPRRHHETHSHPHHITLLSAGSLLAEQRLKREEGRRARPLSLQLSATQRGVWDSAKADFESSRGAVPEATRHHGAGRGRAEEQVVRRVRHRSNMVAAQAIGDQIHAAREALTQKQLFRPYAGTEDEVRRVRRRARRGPKGSRDEQALPVGAAPSGPSHRPSVLGLTSRRWSPSPTRSPSSSPEAARAPRIRSACCDAWLAGCRRPASTSSPAFPPAPSTRCSWPRAAGRLADIIEELRDVWESLELKDVFRIDSRSLARNVSSGSGTTIVQALVDTTPLRQLLAAVTFP